MDYAFSVDIKHFKEEKNLCSTNI